MPGVRMPRFRFTEEQLVSLVAYMESEFVDFDKDIGLAAHAGSGVL